MSGQFQRSQARIQFSPTELRDLLIAWVALGVAFAIFFGRGAVVFEDMAIFTELLVISILTAGVGFLLHELAHKVTAVHFGQIAAFRANYPMLAIAIGAALAGFIFAAPGAVYHRGRITARENGIIAIAGPLVNIALAILFIPLLLVDISIIVEIGRYGVLINLFLAAFNLLPFGPLDGKKVLGWSRWIFIGTFALSVILLLLSVIGLLF